MSSRMKNNAMYISKIHVSLNDYEVDGHMLNTLE